MWRFSAEAQGMDVDIEHVESDNGPVPYWHLQQLLVTEASVTVARGIGSKIGAEVVVPFRLVRSRIRYEDLAGQSFVPSPPDVHHRNETLTGISDPRLFAHVGGASGLWSYGARAGISVPLGRTEPNPFELGRLGLPHQHVQFGTGTWDPLFTVGIARLLGHSQVEATGFFRLPLGENAHGYQAGNLYQTSVTISRSLGGGWGGYAGLNRTREEAERWSDRLEEEGNLGRHDVSLSVGVGRALGESGSFSAGVLAPLHSEAHGEQAESPWLFSLTWSR